jgi:hypothetical protein
MRIFATIMLALALTVGVSAMASAQTVDGYTNQAGEIQSQVQGSGDTVSGTAPAATAPATATDTGGSLPFTGLDVVLLALAGGALVAVGLGMRTLTKAPDSK